MTEVLDPQRRQELIEEMTDVEFLTASRQVLIEDRDELAYGQYIEQVDDNHDKPCHCIAGAALQACQLYIPMDRNPRWLVVPTEYTSLESVVVDRLAGLLEPCFDVMLILAAVESEPGRNVTDFADTDQTVTWYDLLHPEEADQMNLTEGALIYTYNDYVLHRLGRSAAKSEAIALYDRAIERAQKESK